MIEETIVQLVPKERGYNQQCIELAERLLERSKNGEINELIVQFTLKDGTLDSAYTGSMNLFEQIGKLICLQDMLLARTRGQI